VNYPVCGNLSITAENSTVSLNGFLQLRCSYILNEDQYLCFNECQTPCVIYDYTVSISSAAWPHISTQASFYNTFISGKARFGSAYDEYQVVLGNAAGANSSASNELLQKLDSQRLIANNFLQLNIMFDGQAFDIREDVAAFPVESLRAQIGGVLSLWLGVTIMLLFELFEFFFTLVAACYQSSKSTSTV